MPLLLVAAFAAGLLSILAPCTWPVVPVVLGASAGGGGRRPLGVIVGLVTTFILVTVALASILAALGLTTATLRTLAVIVLAGVALSLLVPRIGAALAGRLDDLSEIGTRIGGRGVDRDGFVGGLILGAAVGLIWAPCVGPIMAGVIAIAATQGPTPATLAIAVAYAAGAAIPLFVVAVRGRAITARVGGRFRGDAARRVMGGLMLVSCLAIATGADVRLQTAATDLLPAGWTNALYALEEVPTIEDGVRALDGQAPAPGAGTSIDLSDLGPAPELRGITAWINSEPISVASLRGKVVLVHFWTFGCINCRNVQPYVEAWYDKYHDAGFEIIGVHTPELSFERDLDNVRAAVVDQGVKFPVAFDPSFSTWQAFSNRYWPAFYYIDRAGEIRYVHAGEGSYEEQEAVIRELLAEPPST